MKTPRILQLRVAGLLWLATKLVVSGETPAGLDVNFTVTPAATGEQVVRRSLPLPRGFLHTNQAVLVRAGQVMEPVGLRVLSWYPATNAESRTARRALVTFCHRFANSQPVAFTLEATNAMPEAPGDFPVTLSTTGDSLQLAWKDGRHRLVGFILLPVVLFSAALFLLILAGAASRGCGGSLALQVAWLGGFLPGPGPRGAAWQSRPAGCNFRVLSPPGSKMHSRGLDPCGHCRRC
jgi:hypothetical protein